MEGALNQEGGGVSCDSWQCGAKEPPPLNIFGRNNNCFFFSCETLAMKNELGGRWGKGEGDKLASGGLSRTSQVLEGTPSLDNFSFFTVKPIRK
jgi:hypothetical protein